MHFLYDWTGQSVWAAPFSGVNESTWEHMKLLYFPMFIYGLIQSRFFRDRKDFWCVKLIGMVVGLTAIPVLFYTYNGAFGKSPDWVNIAIFYISALIVFLFEWLAFKNDRLQRRHPGFPFAAICMIGVLFVAYTIAAPQIPLFRDPLTGDYGISTS